MHHASFRYFATQREFINPCFGCFEGGIGIAFLWDFEGVIISNDSWVFLELLI